MTEVEFWKTLPKKGSFAYPYSPQRNIFPEDDDKYDRSTTRLLLSFISLGKKFLSEISSDTNAGDVENILRMIRISENKTQPRDLMFFISSAEASDTKTSKLLICRNTIDCNISFDWKTVHQAVFVRPISQTKCSVYLASLDTGRVDVYSVGKCEIVELQQFGLEIMNYFRTSMPGKSFSFSHRLTIPSAFEEDIMFLGFVLAVQLHRHANIFI
jgi:hypothetical protein